MFQIVSGAGVDRRTFKKDMTYMRIVYKSNE